jgi:hypothetical protein
MPIDHDKTIEIPKNFGEVFINHLISNVNLCITDQSFLLIIFAFLCVLILFFRTKNDIKIAISSLVCLLSFYVFYVIGCAIMPTIFLNFDDEYMYFKQLILLNVTLLFYPLILLDYLLFRIEEKYKINSNILKNILVIIFLFVFVCYYNNIKELIELKVDSYLKGNIYKKEFYQLDKTILKQKENDIIYLPVISFDENCFFNMYYIYFQNIYNPEDFGNKKFIITEEQKLEPLTEDEEKSLKFSNLLEQPIKKLKKKDIINIVDPDILDNTEKSQ